MHFTSWDRSDKERPTLLVGRGPEELASFTASGAEVDGQHWRTEVDEQLGASATSDDGRTYRLAGNLKKDKTLQASLEGRTFSLVNESGSNWVIFDVNDHKVAQFSGANNGVREAILEFENDEDDSDPDSALELSRQEVAALSWFSRVVLENRLSQRSVAIIGTLVLLSAVAVLAVLI